MTINFVTIAAVTQFGGLDDAVAVNEDPIAVAGVARFRGIDTGEQVVVLQFGGTGPTLTLTLEAGTDYTLGTPGLLGGTTVTYHFNIPYGDYKALNLTGTSHTVDFLTIGSAGAPAHAPLILDIPDTFNDLTCFVRGTLIGTPRGAIPIEALKVGETVSLASGGSAPIRWLGHRRFDAATCPSREKAAPVRIRAGAFADHVPGRDLLVSPDHAIFVDGKLICARQLINGATIRLELEWDSVEYFHIELDTHSILLAEGLPTESYLDTGNRSFFRNSDEPLMLHPDLTDEAAFPDRAAGSCVPFVTDEASVRPVWRRLADRAAALGQLRTQANPELRLVAKGRILEPLYGENGLRIFVLPKGVTEDVRLVSRAGAPTDTRPWLDDRRCLGVFVEQIVLRGASDVREVPIDHPSLSRGWWSVERHGTAMRRWTNGDAVVPLPKFQGPAMLEIKASSGGMTYVASDDEDRRAA